MERWVQGLVMLLALALAAPAAADDRVSGFETYATGELRGSVTDEGGRPLRGITVYVASKGGAPIASATTDDTGLYRLNLGTAEGLKLVFVKAAAKVRGLTAVGEDVVEIRETLPPKIMPKPITDPSVIPAYSELAKKRDVWTKAWLLLEVSKTGSITRVKLIKAPGHDLDLIAVTEAFKVRFQPARDRADNPTVALMLWSFEWPSYGWLRGKNYAPTRLPVAVAKVPCRGTGGIGANFRDCTEPELVKATSQSWITPFTFVLAAGFRR